MKTNRLNQRHCLTTAKPLNRRSIRSADAAESTEDVTANLAAEYVEAAQAGQNPKLAEYLSRCADARSRREFKIVVAMSALVSAAYAGGEEG